MQKERQHEVRKPIGISKGDHAQVWPVRAQPHRSNDVVNIGGQLLLREGNRVRGARRRRGCLKVAARRGRRRIGGWLLMQFQGTNHRLPAPGAQHVKDELSGMAVRADHRRLARQRLFGLAAQLAEGPMLPGSQIAQSNIPAPIVGDLQPAFVKHLLFVKAILVSLASPITPAEATPPRLTGPGASSLKWSRRRLIEIPPPLPPAQGVRQRVNMAASAPPHDLDGNKLDPIPSPNESQQHLRLDFKVVGLQGHASPSLEVDQPKTALGVRERLGGTFRKGGGQSGFYHSVFYG